MSLTFFLFCILVGLIIFLVVYARWNYNKLDNLGFPVVKPSFLLGSDPQGYKKVQHLEDLKRFNKYGNVYGFFEGRSPQVHVCSPEMIRLILVKDYDYFSERQTIDFGNDITNEVLDWQNEPKWKFLRSIITPNFASHRIRDMSQCLHELAEEHTSNLKFSINEEKVAIEFRNFVSSLITKTIEKCYCGVLLENRLDPSNTFDILMKKLLGEFTGYDIKHELVRAFPFLIKFYPTIPSEPLQAFRQLVLSLIKDRQDRTKEKINLQYNFTDTLCDLLAKAQTLQYKHLQISENNAVALALEFFLATFDSVTTPVVFLAYYLAVNADIQEKVFQEVDSTEDGEKMPYLHACFQEALRLTPPFFKVERKCTKDWEYKGMKIPKGVGVIIPIWAVNRHPKYYDKPEEFIPERFLGPEKEKRSPYAFSTFGHGQKNCVGQRWAYEMGNIIMANFIKEFRFEVRDDTRIKWKEGSSFILKFEPIYLDIVKRN